MKAPNDIIVAGSTKHHGIALWPPPSDNPKDPLRWRRWLKILAIVSVSLFNFTANFAGAGFSVATPVLQIQFQKTPNQVNALLTFNFLLLGLGNLFWVPFSIKFGKRAALLISMTMLFIVLLWTAKASTFQSLLAARCLSGFASSAGESIVPGIVSDLFFLHERAAMMSIYIITVSSATAIGPLIASFVVAETADTWRNFSWLCAGIAGLNLVLMFLLYPESTFVRPPVQHDRSEQQEETRLGDKTNDQESQITTVQVENKPAGAAHNLSNGVQHVHHVDVPWTKIWISIFRYNKSAGLLRTFSRPLCFLVYPSVVWVVFVYGTSLAAQVILIFAFPSLLLAPPYLWTPTYIGLIQIAALIGFALGTIGGGWLSDIITTRRIVKEKGHAYPEQRLISLLPGCLIAPAGCILIAFACSQKLTWVAIAIGYGMLSFGTVYGPNIAITYLVDSYPQFTQECLVVVNAFKNLVSFVFLYVAVDWVAGEGWVQVYMIMFMLVTLTTLLAIPLYFWGSRLRRASEKIYFPDVTSSE